MIRYQEISFVAYPVTDMARSRKFYEGVLGLKSNGYAKDPRPKWVEYDLGPGTLAIGKSPQYKPSRNGPIAALEVKNFDESVAHLRKHRVKFIIGPVDFPSCRMVGFRDPDGNQLALHHRKPRRRK